MTTLLAQLGHDATNQIGIWRYESNEVPEDSKSKVGISLHLASSLQYPRTQPLTAPSGNILYLDKKDAITLVEKLSEEYDLKVSRKVVTVIE